MSIGAFEGLAVKKRREDFGAPRRRRYGSGPLLRAIAPAFAGVLFFLFVVISLLAPSPSPTGGLEHHLPGGHSSAGGGGEAGSDSNERFRVPTGRESLGRDIWSSRLSNFYHGCSNAGDHFTTADLKTHPNRYLVIATSGGLNQQRTGITDAVVAAYILNATLVVPKLDQKSFWKDSSNFADIFDDDWFISFLSNDVKIVKQLPFKEGKDFKTFSTRVPRKCTPSCYLSRLLPLFNKRHVVQLTKFDYRLSNRLDTDLQKLRCRVNYHALRFTDSLLEMGKKLVEKMRLKSKNFIALHLRFEPDMLAFSGCDYGGGEKEKRELGKIRKRWKTLHKKNPDKERRQGKCPLTPEEVGLMLRALGYGRDVHIYVASGEIYGGDETLAPLKALFPNFHSKYSIMNKKELAPFQSFSSRMAALDFHVCDESDVFVTNNNGNMAKILAGRRKYFGHKPTIRPNAKKLYKLFMDRNNMTWEAFASKVRSHQIGFMGEPNEVKPGRGEFHENPSACICENPEAKTGDHSALQSHAVANTKSRKEYYARQGTGEVIDDQSAEDDPDWSDQDYVDNENVLPGKGSLNGTAFGVSVFASEQSELDQIFSD